MRKQRFKTAKLFLKLLLLFQIYSHHCFKAETTERSFSESVDKVKVGEETVLNDQISYKETGLSVSHERLKRPARLLPLKILR